MAGSLEQSRLPTQGQDVGHQELSAEEIARDDKPSNKPGVNGENRADSCEKKTV